jgi:hypothetical protein
VPPGALGVGRAHQQNLEGYAERRAARRLREQSEGQGAAADVLPEGASLEGAAPEADAPDGGA